MTTCGVDKLIGSLSPTSTDPLQDYIHTPDVDEEEALPISSREKCKEEKTIMKNDTHGHTQDRREGTEQNEMTKKNRQCISR